MCDDCGLQITIDFCNARHVSFYLLLSHLLSAAFTELCTRSIHYVYLQLKSKDVLTSGGPHNITACVPY